MIHARPDYDRIQDPALDDPSLLAPGSKPIAKDEPVFLIRARDENAPGSVRDWADRAERNGASPDIVAHARRHADLMEEWQILYGRKTPDLPGRESA